MNLPSIKQDPKTLKSFGLVVGGVFCALGAWIVYRGHIYGAVFLAAGLTLLLGGLLRPSALKSVHRVWMTLAFCMGWVMTRVILTLFYYLAVTPVGLAVRASRRADPLQRTRDQQATSYWIPKAVKPDIRNQF